MALIAVAADKGSPGVTTTAVALAAVWPRRVLLAETDPAGGDLVYRSRAAHGGVLDPNSGLLSLAATARRGLAAEQLWDHAQPLVGGLDVLVGIGSAEQAAGLAGLWPMLGQAFATLDESPNGAADVIADCGRIGADSPTLELFAHSALVLLVSRTEAEHLARVRDRAARSPRSCTVRSGAPPPRSGIHRSAFCSSPIPPTAPGSPARSTTCWWARRSPRGSSAPSPTTRPVPRCSTAVVGGGWTSRC